MIVLVIDVGSSSVRVTALDESLGVRESASSPYPTQRSGTTTVTFDPAKLAELVVGLTRRVHGLLDPREVKGIALTNQRASAVLFTLCGPTALGLGLSWEDLRTAPQCLALSQKGFPSAPNESATKYVTLLASTSNPDARVGTLDTWLAAVLTEGTCFGTDVTNAAVTGLTDTTGTRYDPEICGVLGLDPALLAPIVTPFLPRGSVNLNGSLVPLLVTIGDQQASLIGQGGLIDSRVKITLGTSAVADTNTHKHTPTFARRGPCGTFPIVVDATEDGPIFGLEAFGVTSGSLLTWLTEIKVLPSPTGADHLARTAKRAATPLLIPAQGGLGAPHWDFGARTIISGITDTTGQAEMALAALEGIAFLAADLVRSLWSDAGLAPGPLYLDGKVGQASLVLERLSGALGVPIAVSSSSEATTRGAGLLALTGLGHTPHIPDPRIVDGTKDRALAQELFASWQSLLPRARGAIPALSAVAF